MSSRSDGRRRVVDSETVEWVLKEINMVAGVTVLQFMVLVAARRQWVFEFEYRRPSRQGEKFPNSVIT